MTPNGSDTAITRLENRSLQALLVVTIGILAFFLVNMFDRFEREFNRIDAEVAGLEDEAKNRDQKIGSLMLQIESRLATLEATIDTGD